MVAERKASTQGNRTAGILGSLPGQLPDIPRQKSPGEIEADAKAAAAGNGEDDEYEYYEDDEEEEEEASGDK